ADPVIGDELAKMRGQMGLRGGLGSQHTKVYKLYALGVKGATRKESPSSLLGQGLAGRTLEVFTLLDSTAGTIVPPVKSPSISRRVTSSAPLWPSPPRAVIRFGVISVFLERHSLLERFAASNFARVVARRRAAERATPGQRGRVG